MGTHGGDRNAHMPVHPGASRRSIGPNVAGGREATMPKEHEPGQRVRHGRKETAAADPPATAAEARTCRTGCAPGRGRHAGVRAARPRHQGVRPRARPPADRALEAAGVGASPGLEARRHLRGTRRGRQGRRHSAHHAAPEPPLRAGRGARGAHRARADAVVLPALRGAPAGGRGDRPVRPQLVQPGRRGARHGLLHRRRVPRVPALLPGVRADARSAPASRSSSTGSPSATKNRSGASRTVSPIPPSAGS